MAKVMEVTDATFAQEIEGHQGLAVVDFKAEWCGPCHMIAPTVEALAREWDGKARIASLDADANQRTVMRFNVRGLPTLLFFKNGQVVDSIVGAVPKSAIEAKMAKHAA